MRDRFDARECGTHRLPGRPSAFEAAMIRRTRRLFRAQSSRACVPRFATSACGVRGEEGIRRHGRDAIPPTSTSRPSWRPTRWAKNSMLKKRGWPTHRHRRRRGDSSVSGGKTPATRCRRGVMNFWPARSRYTMRPPSLRKEATTFQYRRHRRVFSRLHGADVPRSVPARWKAARGDRPALTPASNSTSPIRMYRGRFIILEQK